MGGAAKDGAAGRRTCCLMQFDCRPGTVGQPELVETFQPTAPQGADALSAALAGRIATPAERRAVRTVAGLTPHLSATLASDRPPR